MPRNDAYLHTWVRMNSKDYLKVLKAMCTHGVIDGLDLRSSDDGTFVGFYSTKAEEDFNNRGWVLSQLLKLRREGKLSHEEHAVLKLMVEKKKSAKKVLANRKLFFDKSRTLDTNSKHSKKKGKSKDRPAWQRVLEEMP